MVSIIAKSCDKYAGVGGWKKRMHYCNRSDRGFNVTPRENGQTSNWSFIARKLEESIE